MYDWLCKTHGDSVIAKGLHPNEQGHALWAEQMTHYLDAKILA